MYSSPLQAVLINSSLPSPLSHSLRHPPPTNSQSPFAPLESREARPHLRLKLLLLHLTRPTIRAEALACINQIAGFGGSLRKLERGKLSYSSRLDISGWVLERDNRGGCASAHCKLQAKLKENGMRFDMRPCGQV
jgi:hypothetical protein